MKSKKLKRILALVLCMALLLSTGLSALASTEGAAETPVPEVTDNQEPQAASVEGEEETTAGETTPTETTTTESQEQQPEVPAEANTDNAPETTEAPETKGTESVSGIKDLVGGTETQTEPEVVSEAVELKQEFTDANGKVVQRVTANVPEGAFTAKASEITMEVTYLDEAAENRIKEMMTKQLPENDILGDYILYDIKFKVNGTVTEPKKAIAITLEGSGLHIEDTKKANAFYIDPADPAVENDKDEIIEITQKNEMIENLQKAGQSTENIDEYDLSEISVNADGVAEKILMEGRISTIYGCYVEKTPEPVQTLNYEDDDVQVRVDAYTENAIPAGAELRVVPIKPDDNDTKDQYKEVEEQLNKKAENEEYDIAGFLAYDIYFADTDGNKVEPNGDVKVTMEYKKETLPENINEEDAKDSDVTVLHLEEDAEGKVENVVDMASKEQLKTIKTTDKQAVKKAEFVTDSFSYYTVVWKIGDEEKKVNVYLVDASTGKQFGTKSLGQYGKDLANEKNVPLADIGAYAIKEKDVPSGYAYVGGYINAFRTGTVATAISYNTKSGDKKKWHYQTNGGWAEWTDAGEKPKVYLAFAKKEGNLETVTTLDNKTAGITMKMVDLTGYDAKGNVSSAAGNTYIGTDSTNKVKIGGGYNQQTGAVTQGLVKSVLEGKYPVTTGISNGTADQNLSKIFAGAQTVNHLFLEKTYNETGYYEYSSFQNYAYLNANRDFTVYKQIGTPSNSNQLFYQRGNFMPYNKIINDGLSLNTNLYDEDGNPLKGVSGDRKGEVLYKTQGTNNYYFGMTVEARFLQPKNGIVKDADDIDEAMVFEFNGDDDLWIFIDDVLVLDIGGIHDAHSGSINFATGKVVVHTAKTGTETTTIRAMFEKAGKLPNGDNWDASKAEEYFTKNTFKNYTNHMLKMFYMERGASASNLHMKFNLQTVPDGQIEVQKELSNTDKEEYANEQFKFQIFVQEKAENYIDEFPSYKDNEYIQLTTESMKTEKITAKMKGTGTAITFDKDGNFYLKPGQIAVFSGLKNNRKYYVKEVGVNPQEYDKIEITDTKVTEYDENAQIANEAQDVQSSEKEVHERPLIVFTNNCSKYNSRELHITKEMAAGQTTTDTFSFKIQLSNQDGKLVPYVGDYYLKDGSGNYYEYQNNRLVKANESTICGKTSEEGIVSGVPVGFTVVIVKILSGTNFHVEEVNLDENNYYPPTKEVSVCDNATVDGADGAICLGVGEDAKVLITNEKRTNNLFVKKVDSADTSVILSGAKFRLEKKEGGSWRVVKKEGADYIITTKENGIAGFTDLASGEYRVTEIEAPEGYITENKSFEVTLPYIKTNPEDNTITVDESSQIGSSGTYCTITKTVTNTKKTWEIIKRSSQNNNLTLSGAEFVLIPDKVDEKRTTYYGKSNDNGKIIWFKDETRTETLVSEKEILPGKYTIKETKAPTGYMCSTESWTVNIGQNGSFISIEGIDSQNKQEKDNKVTCYFENTAVYELPSTGGPGIFWYMIGGVLLMMAGVLILYKNKYRGVLESK